MESYKTEKAKLNEYIEDNSTLKSLLSKTLFGNNGIIKTLNNLKEQREESDYISGMIKTCENNIKVAKESLSGAEKELASLEYQSEDISVQKDELNESLSEKINEYNEAVEQETAEEEKKKEEELAREEESAAQKESEEQNDVGTAGDDDIEPEEEQTVTTTTTTTYYTYETDGNTSSSGTPATSTTSENGWREGKNFDSAAFYAKFGYTDSGVALNRTNGVVYYNGHKETYYSERILPGNGLNIPGRHTDEQGLVRDGDGYICVASSDLPKGTTIQTSLGLGKVYDSGCASGTIDIYTNW